MHNFMGGNMYSIFEMLLREKGLTVADVCRATGIRQSTMSNWKSRNNMLSAKNAQLIANFFGVSVDFLMGRNEYNLVPKEEYERLKEKIDKQLGGYYFNDETARVAHEMFTDPDMKSLFHMKQTMDPKKFKTYMDFIKAQYKLEHPEE